MEPIDSSPALNVIRTGPRDAPAVVFVHAVGLDLTYWDRQIDALRIDYDVIAFDLPGHGRSPGIPQDWTFAKTVETIACLIRDAVSGPVHLVGISFGSMLVQKVAFAHPELVLSLTLMGSASTFSEAARTGMRVRAEATRRGGMRAVLDSSLDRWFTSETKVERPHLIDRISKTVLDDEPAVHAAIWDLIANDFDVSHRLGEIRRPTLVLVGEHDPNTPPAAASAVAAGIGGSQIVVIAHASHMVNLEAPDEVNAELLRFLFKCSDTTSVHGIPAN